MVLKLSVTAIELPQIVVCVALNLLKLSQFVPCVIAESFLSNSDQADWNCDSQSKLNIYVQYCV